MIVSVSRRLADLYTKKNKNYEYSLEMLINSFDPDCYDEAVRLLESYKFSGDKIELEISKECAESIKELFSNQEIDSDKVELILWIAVLFPEIWINGRFVWYRNNGVGKWIR